MASHQRDPQASSLWLYFQSVVAWVRANLPTYPKEMKGWEWSILFIYFNSEHHDTAKLESHVTELMLDEELQNNLGIYTFVVDGLERHLSLRTFNDKQKRETYERQDGICAKCGQHFEFDEMAGDHIIAWSKGGKTVPSNCQMLWASDNGSKGDS